MAAALAALQCGPPEAKQPEKFRPSIILISIDTLRQDHVGHYGYDRDVTPGLDELAKEALVFDRAYAPASWTLISHMTMLTGLYPSQHGVITAKAKASPAIPMLAERLQAQGYYTIGLTHGGWVGSRYGFDRGFDVFGERMNNGARLDKTLKVVMGKRPSDRPFFLFMQTWDVHGGNVNHPESTIYFPPEGYGDLYVEGAALRLKGMDSKRVWKGEQRVTPDQRESLIGLYDGGIRYTDDLITSWVRGWREEGVLDDTILVVTSDHGESLWQRGGINQSHGGVYEEGLRIPLMIRFPDGAHAGERRSELVSLSDLVPTLIDYLGLPRDSRLAGRSLLEELPGERVILAERKSSTVIYQWPYKAVLGPGKPRIFDLESDPEETSPMTALNAPGEFEKLLARLSEERKTLVSEWTPVPDSTPDEVQRTPEEIAELEALGYFGDE